MTMKRIAAAFAALALAAAPAALGAQGHAHHGQARPAAHAPQAQHHGAGHAAHAAHAAGGMKCAHGEGAHSPAPAMLLMHRADLRLTDAQAQRLQALRADDAAGAREVLTPEQRTRMTQVHAAMAASHGEGGHAHEGCCKDGKCTAECEECCRGMECCKDGKCTAECEECCRRMSAAAAQGQAAPARP